MSKQEGRKQCLDKSNRAIDLAIAELARTRGGEIVRGENERQFILGLNRETSGKRIRAEIKMYLQDTVGGVYSFKKNGRTDIRVGDVRPVDLVISRHLTSETQERFIVVDLDGSLYKGTDKYPVRYRVRLEAWCRLYYLPERAEWFVHFVDIIVRHRPLAQRVLFTFEHGESGELVCASEADPSKLCLFFETPQGGMWG